MLTDDRDQALWNENHPVLELLRRRRSEASVPGRRTDDAKLGLAVEGGGMRGVVSAAMLTALEDLGFAQAFDVIYGTSSGAINAAYFLGGRTWYPLSIYFDDLSTRQFIDFKRALRGASILNVEGYAFDVVIDLLKPLDYESILKSTVPLVIPVTLVDEIRTLAIREFSSRTDLRSTLIGSSWLPVAVKGTTMVHGKRVVDGGVLTALPFSLALDDDCTHVLSLSTKPMGTVASATSLLHRYTRSCLERLRPGLGDGYIAAIRQKRIDQVWLSEQRLAPTPGGPQVLDLAPLPGSNEVKRHELGLGDLLSASRGAYEVVYGAAEKKTVDSLTNGSVRAIPRLTVVERDVHDGGTTRFFDHASGRLTERRPAG